MGTKRTTYKLDIPNPCHEKWEEMETKDKNKFCRNCHKTIIDFTTYSNTELIRYIENSHGVVCGRLRNDQINVDIVEIKYENSNIFKWLASIAFLLFSKITYATNTIKTYEKTIQTDSLNQKNETIKVVKTKIVGFVFDSITKEPLSNGWALMKDPKIAIRIDTIGRFELTIPSNIIQKEIIIEIRQLGYEKTFVKWNADKLSTVINIYMLNKKSTKTVGIINWEKEEKIKSKNIWHLSR